MFFGKRFPRRKELNGEIKNVQRIENGEIYPVYCVVEVQKRLS
ncbi:hypothetical protein B4144_3003 [Bacillus atrophaeus]|nr:hypothetical protein B4144_3003 [Bacillus atrophaeus]